MKGGAHLAEGPEGRLTAGHGGRWRPLESGWAHDVRDELDASLGVVVRWLGSTGSSHL